MKLFEVAWVCLFTMRLCGQISVPLWIFIVPILFSVLISLFGDGK